MLRTVAVLLALATALAAQTPQRPKILGVAHMALAVSDVSASRAFYTDLLGFQEVFDLRNADGSLAMTFLKVNDYQYIELFPGLDRTQDRLKHISFYTDDAEGMRRYLAARGAKVPERTPKGRIGNSNFTTPDPDGHGVEIVEYEPGGWSMRDKGKAMTGDRISTRILHLGVIVGSLAKSMEFYHGLLGFEELWRGSSRGYGKLSWVNLRVPDGEDYLELMLYDDLPAPDKRGSQHHICLQVPSVEEAAKRLRAKPAIQGYGRTLEPKTGVNRRRQLNLFDPDGTRIELMEPTTVDGRPAPSSTMPPPHGG
jgi:lactoylglutathione lyase